MLKTTAVILPPGEQGLAWTLPTANSFALESEIHKLDTRQATYIISRRSRI